MTNEPEKTFSPLCLERAKQSTLREITSSVHAGWTALLVQTLESSARVQEYTNAPVPDLSLAVVVNGVGAVECYANGGRQKVVMRPGDACATASGKTERHLIQSLTLRPIQTLHVYIPAGYFADAAEEYRRAGVAARFEQPDLLGFTDSTVAAMGFALVAAVTAGAPNLYAESAAQFLAAHLLLTHNRQSETALAKRNPGVIADRRLRRVLEFMRHHSAQDLTVAELAREAGVSRFHFINLFKKACGTTPHQHLVKLRLERAAAMLENTDLSIAALAASCGFVAPSHFSAAFRRHFGQTASEYKSRILGSTR